VLAACTLLVATVLAREAAPPPALPLTMPTALAAGPDDTILAWTGGRRATRSLVDGATLETSSADWRLAGGWEVDGLELRRDGTRVATLEQPAIAIAADTESLWVRDRRGLLRIHPAPLRISKDVAGTAAMVPYAGGLAWTYGQGIAMADGEGALRCRLPDRARALATSPDGQLLLALDDRGLALIDRDCQVQGGAPVGGRALAFLDPSRLVVVSRDGALHTLSWPALESVHSTPPPVQVDWSWAQGPAGPVLVSGAQVYDPQLERSVALPPGSLVLPMQGLAFAQVGDELQVLDLGGQLLHQGDKALAGPPRQAVVDGGRWVVSDGLVVVQRSAPSRVDRWVLDEPIGPLRLLPGGEVEGQGSSGATWRLSPGFTTAREVPYRADPADLRDEQGRRNAIIHLDPATPLALLSVGGGAQAVDAAALRALGPRIERWFDEAALSPDGRLLVGRQGEALHAFEVATGALRWTATVDARQAQLRVFADFVAVSTRERTTLLSAETGAVIWTAQAAPDQPGQRQGEGAPQITWSEGSWRADAWGGRSPPPRWPQRTTVLEAPTAGPALMPLPDAAALALRTLGLQELPAALALALCRGGGSDLPLPLQGWWADRCAPPPDPAPWPQQAEVGGATLPALAPLAPGRQLRLHKADRSVPAGAPLLVYYGAAADLPDAGPPGLATLFLVKQAVPEANPRGDVYASESLRRRLPTSQAPVALLLGADGRVLSEGAPAAVLARAADAGLEDVDRRPAHSQTPRWTVRAPAALVDLAVLDGGLVLARTAVAVAVYSPAGALLWQMRADGADAVGDTVDLRRGDLVETRAAVDGALRARRIEASPTESGRSNRQLASASGDAPGLAVGGWFRVPGGWCRSTRDCSSFDPRTLATAGGATLRLDGRLLRGADWQLGGVARLLPGVGDRVPVQLGSGAGPWTTVTAQGALGPLLGRGNTAAAGPGLFVVADGAVLRAYDLP
jgi:hypothetical protein